MSRYPTSSRWAFTLIELCVVIAIAGLLFGLLLGAIQNSRAAASRTACANNLRQQGLAIHAYGDSQGAWPPGCSFLNGTSPYPFAAWSAYLLPYVEQGAVWQLMKAAYATDPNFLSPAHGTYRGIPIKTFVCPADSRPPNLAGGLGVALTWYLGNEGTDFLGAGGTLYLDSKIRPTDVTDGLSNTLLVGERPPSATEVEGWVYFGTGQADSGSLDSVLGARELNYYYAAKWCWKGPYFFGPGRVDNQCDMFHFWSLHLGGANFLFADGSVHHLTYSADSVLPALATRSGGEPVSIP
jgi:prepilin-type processing-associated H-X9-DG protein